MHWRNLAALENQLAELLAKHTGKMVANELDAYYLKIVDGELILCHATFIDGQLADESSRFDFDLEFVDITADELQFAIRGLETCIENFAALLVDLLECEG